MSIQVLEWPQVVSNQYKYNTMRNSYDVIEIDNHVINTLQNFYFWEFISLSIKLD